MQGEALKNGLSDRGHLIRSKILNIAAFIRVQSIVASGITGTNRLPRQEKELGTVQGPGGYKGTQDAAQPRELERKGRTAKEKDE